MVSVQDHRMQEQEKEQEQEGTEHGLPFKAQFLPVENLQVDYTYQRRVTPERVARIAAEWSPARAGAINVSQRADGSLWVFDGGHRVEAARQAGVRLLYAHVFTYDGQREAEEFYHMNSDTARPSALQRFKARLAAGDPIAQGMYAAIQEAGWKVPFQAHVKSPGNLNAISTVELLYRKGGDPATDGYARVVSVLSLIRDTWPMSRSVGNGIMIEAVDMLLRRYGTSINRKVFIQKLGSLDPREVEFAAKKMGRLSIGTSPKFHMLLTLVQEYNKGKRSGALPSPLAFRKDEVSTTSSAATLLLRQGRQDGTPPMDGGEEE